MGTHIALLIVTAVALLKHSVQGDGVNNVKNIDCCQFFPVIDDLLDLFEGPNTCSEDGALMVRLAYSDAMGIDPMLSGGGADGSLVTFSAVELQDPANDGLDNIIDPVRTLVENHEIEAGDMSHSQISDTNESLSVQFAAAIALANCPGAPRVKFMMGRPAATAPAPIDLVPEPPSSPKEALMNENLNNIDTTTFILERFSSIGFSPSEVVSLLAAHSIATASDIDSIVPGTPLDSTPFIFDTQLYIEVALRGFLFTSTGENQGEVGSAVQGVLRLESDHNLARDSRTNCFWQSLASNQTAMQAQFAAAWFKLSLSGHNATSLTDCSDVIPTPLGITTPPHFPPSLSNDNVDQACATAAFPTLPTEPGPPLVVQPRQQDD
ncbi:hypothetical protein CVT26_012539 [Gymnopilus dilepis]|uniref:Peroxidase n=1 Tax=Gymnopilus dilepis TaxID=231916 RepID=A0A409X5L8_9AGAR|nr:hypothetical protein CVT26_012539 [Gymnopilus dilepis]